MNTINELWISYMDQVVPKDAATNQIQECKRAFVAGAKGILGILTAIGEDDVSEDEGVDIIESLHRECRTFVEDVLAGRA